LKQIVAPLALAILAPAFAAGMSTAPTAARPTPKAAMHDCLIERTFPAGALRGLDNAANTKVNAYGAIAGVRWVQSYAGANETKTSCGYEAPSEATVSKAAELNPLPIESIA
jgi:Protein of unknown function (DUF4242)